MIKLLGLNYTFEMPEQNSSNNKLKDIFEYNSNSCSSLVIHLEGGRRDERGRGCVRGPTFIEL